MRFELTSTLSKCCWVLILEVLTHNFGVSGRVEKIFRLLSCVPAISSISDYYLKEIVIYLNIISLFDFLRSFPAHYLITWSKTRRKVNTCGLGFFTLFFPFLSSFS